MHELTPAKREAILRACEPEPRAASREPLLASLKSSRQKIQKRAKCPNMAFITCGVLHICEYPRNFLSNRVNQRESDSNNFLKFLFRIPYIREAGQ